MYQNIRIKNEAAKQLRLVKELSGEKSLSDALEKAVNTWLVYKKYEKLENVFVDNEEAAYLADSNISVSVLASDEDIHVVYYNDEAIKVENGDLYINLKNFSAHETKFNDQSLVTDKITRIDWSKIINE